MKCKCLYSILSLFLFANSLCAQDRKTVFSPQDFAGSIILSGKTGNLMLFELPESIYQGFVRRDRGDLRVFDTNGVLVPFIIRKTPKEIITVPNENVPFFIWDSEKEGVEKFPNSQDIEINTFGSIIRIKNFENKPSNVPVYLIDFSNLSYNPVSISITVDHKDVFFNSTVTIHTSSDLNEWRLLNKKQTIAYYGDSGANQNSLLLPDDLRFPKELRYALLGFEGQAPALISVSAIFAPQENIQKNRETKVKGIKNADGKTIYYDTQGYYPVRAIDFRLQEADSMEVYIRNGYDGEYIMQMKEQIFNFNSRRNEPFNVKYAGRYWELNTTGELPFSTIPECYIIYDPLELVFLARGQEPWMLAYGNSEAFPLQENNLTVLSEDILFSATIIKENIYKHNPIHTDKKWSTWFLWGTLILATVILSILTFYIWHSINDKKSNRKFDNAMPSA